MVTGTAWLEVCCKKLCHLFGWLAENHPVGQPFSLYSKARSNNPELPVVPEGWPAEAFESFSSDSFHNKTPRGVANAIYDSLRMELIKELVSKGCAS